MAGHKPRHRYRWHALVRATAITVGLVGAGTMWSDDAHACQQWRFSVSQEEEGRTPGASACAFDDVGRTFLEVRCFNRQINIRYTPRVNGDFGNQTRPFVFETEASNQRLSMQYEGMDGAFTVYVSPRHPIFEMLMSGRGLNIYLDRQRGIPERRFRLGGSRAAISRLLRACRS